MSEPLKDSISYSLGLIQARVEEMDKNITAKLDEMSRKIDINQETGQRELKALEKRVTELEVWKSNIKAQVALIATGISVLFATAKMWWSAFSG